METSFWFIFIGLAIYGLHILWQKYPFTLSWLMDLCVGAGVGALIGYFRPVYIGYNFLPFWFTALIGALSAIILWLAEKFQLFKNRAVQYTLMILMSLIHASMVFFIYKYTLFSQPPDYLPQSSLLALYIQILLISAISIVGFTFPKRIIKPLQKY